MNIVFDNLTLEAALAATTDEALKTMIDRIAHDAKASGLWEMTCIISLDGADSGEELESVLGFDPLTGPLGDADGEFIPWWDWMEHHPSYFELLLTTGDFAYFVLVPDSGADRSGLAALCRSHPGTME